MLRFAVAVQRLFSLKSPDATWVAAGVIPPVKYSWFTIKLLGGGTQEKWSGRGVRLREKYKKNLLIGSLFELCWRRLGGTRRFLPRGPGGSAIEGRIVERLS